MQIGVWDVESMLQEMSSSQFLEWMEYSNLEPFGEMRGDLRAGIIASTLANVNRTSNRTRPFLPSDFMPYLRVQESAAGEASTPVRAGALGERKPLTDPDDWKALKAQFRAYAGAFGGRPKAGKPEEPNHSPRPRRTALPFSPGGARMR